MPTDGSRDIAFGQFRVDRRNRVLMRGDAAVPLGGRAFDVLVALAAAGGETVGKDALLDQVWPGLTVEENNLQVQIVALRKALGDGWITTIPGRGYRLAMTPEINDPPAREAEGKPAIAVLPFINLSGDGEQEYFADGMTEEIITALSRVRSLVVIARNSSFTYKGRTVDARQIGRELGVRYLVEGSVRKSGDRIRIAGQLADVATGTNLWADRFDGTLADVFDLQDRVAASVIGAVGPRILSVEVGRAQRKPPESLQAYDLVLRAVPHQRSVRPERYIEGKRLARQAIALEPTSAMAHALLSSFAWGQVSQGWVQRGDAALAEVIGPARKALELGGDDPQVLAMVAHRIALPGGDLSGGIALIEQALALNPNSVEALTNGAHLYAYAGDTERAIAYVEQATRLNPLQGNFYRFLAVAIAHFGAGRYADVLDATARVLREAPDFSPALRYRAASFGLLGRIEEGEAVALHLGRVTEGMTVAWARAHLEFDMRNAFRNPGVIDALCEGLRRVGVPEA